MGKEIQYEQSKNVVTLVDDASLQQGTDLAKGDLIVYDTAQDKLSIKSLKSTEGAASQQPAAATDEGAEPATKPSRVKIVITPGQTNLPQ